MHVCDQGERHVCDQGEHHVCDQGERLWAYGLDCGRGHAFSMRVVAQG